MKPTTIFLLSCMLFFVVTLTSYASASDIVVCQGITESGNYRLTNNIINSGSPVCFDILASDVGIDCQNHILAGQMSDYSYAFKTQNTRNITIKNCKVIGWYYPFHLQNVTYSRIKDNYIEIPLPNGGIAFHSVSHTDYINNILNGSYAGLGGDNNDYLRIANSTFYGKLIGGFSVGLYFDNGGDNNLIKDVKIKNFNRAIVLENSSNNTFENVEIEDIMFPYEYGNYPSIAIEFTCWQDCSRGNSIRNFSIKNTQPNLYSPYPSCAVAFIGNSRENILIDGSIASPFEGSYGTYDLCMLRTLYFGEKVDYDIIAANTALNTDYSTTLFNAIYEEANTDFYRKKYLEVNARDALGNDVGNALVSIYDKDNNLVSKGLTDSEGKAKFNLTEFLYRKRGKEDGAITYYSNYTVDIRHPSYSNSYEINLTDDAPINTESLTILLFHSNELMFGRYKIEGQSPAAVTPRTYQFILPAAIALIILLFAILATLIMLKLKPKKRRK